MAKWEVEPSLRQCGLRTLNVTESPGVPECGRAPRYQSREAVYKDGAEEWALGVAINCDPQHGQATNIRAGTQQAADPGILLFLS